MNVDDRAPLTLEDEGDTDGVAVTAAAYDILVEFTRDLGASELDDRG